MLKIEMMKLEDIQPYENNAKIHTGEQVEQIKKSIEEFGFNDPIAIDENNADFDNFKIEFIRDYNYIDTYKEEDFLVIIEYKDIGIDKIYSGMRIKKIIKEIDLNEIFYGTEDEEKEIDSND